jgi:hypothetical protein
VGNSIANTTHTQYDLGGGLRGGVDPAQGDATLLYSQDFESAGWEGDFTGASAWEDHITTTTSNPHSGTTCLRGNQLPGVTDGITGLTGLANTELDWRGSGGNIAGLTPNACCLKYWFRHDDYTHDLDDDGTGDGKQVFFVDDTHGTQAMYLNWQGINPGSIKLVYSNGAYSDAWASTNWGYTSLFLSSASVDIQTDGTWHELTYYINYDDKYVQVWIDGHIMKHAGKHGEAGYEGILTADGKSYYESSLTLKTEGFQFWWVRQGNIDESTDGTGYAAGWQIDDLRVYDGLVI